MVFVEETIPAGNAATASNYNLPIAQRCVYVIIGSKEEMETVETMSCDSNYIDKQLSFGFSIDREHKTQKQSQPEGRMK